MNKEFDMLDKDIKILREFTESSCHLYSQEEIIEATKNVLLELEKKNYDIKALEEDNIHLMEYASDVLKTNDKLAENLETYNKIAEFLAKNSVVRAKCERCVEDLDENGCIRCMLNWAKSEVLKDE